MSKEIKLSNAEKVLSINLDGFSKESRESEVLVGYNGELLYSLRIEEIPSPSSYIVKIERDRDCTFEWDNKDLVKYDNVSAVGVSDEFILDFAADSLMEKLVGEIYLNMCKNLEIDPFVAVKGIFGI